MIVIHRNQLDKRIYLVHHGIKGQKWGVRRTPEELGHYTKKRFYELIKDGNMVSSKGIKITTFSNHAFSQLHDPTRTVAYGDILNAIREPLYVKPIKIDTNNRPSQQYIGKRATVAVNPKTGVITTIWKTGSKTVEKYS